MSEKERQRGLDFARFMQSLSEEQKAEGNRKILEQSKAEHERFSTKFEQDLCYLCDGSIKSFDRKSPCAHWLLKPQGFTKADFPSVTKRYGYFQLEAYLRWVANTDSFARNINDLKDEGTGKLYESTIKYREFEWAFSCSESDYLGHATTKHARHAHYHFQMRVHGYIFIRYNDCHIPFKDREIHSIEAMRTLPNLIKRKNFFGEGMDEVLNDETAEQLVNLTVAGGTEDEALFKIDTFIMADEGTTMRGEDLFHMMEEAKAKKVTMASLAHKIPNASVRVIVSPGPGVIAQALRSGGRKKRDGDAVHEVDENSTK